MRVRTGLYCVLGLITGAPVLEGVSAQAVVSFPSPDGGVVYADLRGNGDHAVVFVHGGQFTKDSWAEQAQVLADRGFQTIAIDLRGRGQSRGGPGKERDDDFSYLDVLGAVSFAEDLGASRVSLIGASWGGWAAARAAAELEAGAVDRLVLLAHSPIEQPERIQGRKLFITTRDDFMGSGTLRLPGIRDQFDRAPEPKELVVLEGSAHAQHVFRTDQGPRLWNEILRFMLSEAPGGS